MQFFKVLVNKRLITMAFIKLAIKKYKIIFVSLFSFMLGCMLSISVIEIDRGCESPQQSEAMLNSNSDEIHANPLLIVIILSAPNNINRRDVIRNTWTNLKDNTISLGKTKYIEYKTKYYFVVGKLDLTETSLMQLKEEQLKYNDILLLPLIDSYSNLTLKVLQSFIWLHEQTSIGHKFNYVLKCDDDSFVKVNYLTQELTKLDNIYIRNNNKLKFDAIESKYISVDKQINEFNINNKEMHLYWGYFNGNAKIKTSGKWKETSWILCDNYIPYALGGGYVVSHGVVQYLAENAQNLRLYNSEDISVGAWLGPLNNLIRIHDKRFDTEWTSRGCRRDHLISHNVAPKEMQEMYDNLLKTSNHCPQEEVKRHDYMYNWNALPKNCCNRQV